MKIKKIKLTNFRRFTDLTIEGLPETVKLVVMIGPNGSGKSSVFDALLRFRYVSGAILRSRPDSYLIKFQSSEEELNEEPGEEVSEEPEEKFKEPKIEFYKDSPNNQNAWKRSVHVRSAYRNDALESSYRYLSENSPLIEQTRFRRLAGNDEAVASNYDRILSPWLKRMSGRKKTGETPDEIDNDLYGELQEAIQELFKDPQLTLTGLGDPQDGKIFEFDKGTSQGFSYENLSSGEKAALDLVLDIIVAKSEFNDTVFCIDEPEAHIHTKLQGPLLNQLYKLIPDNSQLWIATHSVGMVRKAQDLRRENPDSVVFLDFGDEKLNFDKEETIKPTPPNPKLWERTYDIALGDLAELVASEQYIFCEGTDFDETCYQNIFSPHYPETRFISMGSSTIVAKVVKELKGKIAKGAKVIGVVDRDNATCGDVKRNAIAGIRTLSEKTIESYLLDNEVLIKLCEHYGQSDKVNDLLAAKQDALDSRGLEASDNLKPIAQYIHGVAQRILKSVRLGNSKESFMRDILAPLIQPSMDVYKKLHNDIFGE